MSYTKAPQVMRPDRDVRTRENGLAIAGLVCGLLGLLALAIVLGPLAIIFGGLGLSRANDGANHRTMSIWAIALGVLDIVLWLVLMMAASSNGVFFG